jgi:hypothetical protein
VAGVLVRPDDEVYRVDAVWLGPQGMTLPWTARYSAYGIWVTLFVGVLLVEAVLPMPVSVPPVWELVVTVLATYAITGLVDHDRPLRSVWQLARAELLAPRPARGAGAAAAGRGARAGSDRSGPVTRFSASSVRVRTLEELEQRLGGGGRRARTTTPA